MRLTYLEHADRARTLRTFCEDDAGLSPTDATSLAERFAARPLSKQQASKLLAHSLMRARQRGDAAQVQRIADVITTYMHANAQREERRHLMARTIPAGDDPLVLAGFRLLQRLEPDACPPLEKVRVGACAGNAEYHAGLILISDTSDYYDTADPLRIAELLYHEQWHAQNGGDEPAARAASDHFYERHKHA